MTAREAAKYQLKNLKGKPLKEKLTHILTYYWLPVVLAAVAAGAVCSMVLSARQELPVAISVYCLNARLTEQSDAPEALFAERTGTNREQSRISILCAAYESTGDTVATAQMQSFVTHLTAGEVDVLAGDPESIRHLAANGCFRSLEAVLSPERLAAAADRLLYIDQAEVDRVFETVDADISGIVLGSPEHMENPVPVAVVLPGDSILCRAYRFPEGNVLMGVPDSTGRETMAAAFLEMCIQ